MWITDLWLPRASVYPAFSLPFILPTASVSFDFLSTQRPTDSHLQCLAFSFGATLINQGHAKPGQIINVIMAILVISFFLSMIVPEMQGTNLPLPNLK